MLIRQISPDDAAGFLAMLTQLDQETRFMLLEPGERTTTVEQTKARIEAILSAPNSTIFVAEEDGQIVGYLRARGGDYNRNRHCVHIDCGILEAFTGRGVGTRLFIETEDWARETGIHRLELTVMTHNERAVVLYKKMGFELEGTKRHSFLVDGRYVDDYYMAKLLPQDTEAPERNTNL